MTFDMKTARALCNQATFTATGNPIDETLKLLVDQAGMLPAALDRISELESSAKADEARLIAAAEKARITYFGCDTPDHLADRILELEEALIEERLRYNSLLREQGDGYGPKYDTEEFAYEELRSEGKI